MSFIATNSTVHRVVGEQVRKVVRGNQVVDGDDFEPPAPHGLAVDEPTDATKSVDTNFYAHMVVLRVVTSVRVKVLLGKLGRKRGILVAS